MSRISRRVWFPVILLAAPLLSFADPPQPIAEQKVASELEQKPARFKVQTGGELPFHVVDFHSGKHAQHCGCPSVMINNHKARGLVIWTKGLDDASIRIATAADKAWIDGAKKQAYLVVFDVSDDVVSEQLKKTPLKNVSAGNPRHSSQQQFANYDIDVAAAQHILLVEGKQIKALWSLKAGELTKDKEDEILKVAEKHFADK